MNTQQKRKRRPRSDKGRPRGPKVMNISPEYARYLSRYAHDPRDRLTEAEVLARLSVPCALCGAASEVLKHGVQYCPDCDACLGVFGALPSLKAWLAKVAEHRFKV